MPVFLYTDIEGSTKLWEKHRQVMSDVMDRHDELLLDCIKTHRGQHVKNSGDGMLAVFHDQDAEPLACALAMQRCLAAEPWPDIDELRVRIALHAGPADYRAGDYFGPTINRLARLMATAWGGQIILTPEAAESAALPPDARLVDLGVHLLKDLTEPQPVLGLVHDDLPLTDFPPLRSMSSRPNNLPRQTTPLVGRERELAEIDNLLAQPDCRLLTLVAPGGMGKTRLGLQAAAEQIDRFSHGVYFIPLAGVTSPDNLPSAIANALRIPFYGADDLESQLHSYLREKQLLLLLDNFEHLIAGARMVADLLVAAPDIKILVTSRRRLLLHAEWAFDVPGLSVPQKGSPVEEGAYESVQLFLQSARRVQPVFDPLPEDLRAIARVCRLVDGMPLALELAAAWINTLSCEEIAAEIERDLELLATEMRDIPERQRSVQAVFDHAWKALLPTEQAAFAGLSVFRGGFTREAAHAVTEANLRILGELTNKSLLTRDEGGRFHIHELLRQFAAVRLAEDEENSYASRQRHAAYFADFLEGIEKPLIRGARIEPVDEINADLDNVLLAWRWAIDHLDLSLMQACMRSLFWFYEAKAWYSEGEELFRAAAESLSVADRQEADYAFVLTNMKVRQAWFAARLSHHNKALATIPSDAGTIMGGDDLEGGWVVRGVEINSLYGLGKYEAARRILQQYDAYYEENYEYSRTWPWSKAQTYTNLGRVAGALGEYDQARQLLEQGLEILRTTGDQMGVMLYLHTLGGVVRIVGEREYARQLFQEGLDLAEAHGYPMGKALALSDLGDLAYQQGEYAAAKEYFASSLALTGEIGDRRGRALALSNLGRIATAVGEYEEARQLFEEGLEITQQSGNRRGMALTLIRLSEVYRLMGDLDRAEAYSCQSEEICRELGYRKGEILAQISRGEVFLARENYHAAREDFQQSLAASESVGFARGAVRSLIELGRTAHGLGEFALAETHLRRALTMAARASRLPRAALTAMAALGATLISEDELEKGTELLALAAHHPLADRHTKENAAGKLESVRERLSPAVFDNFVEHGRAQTMQTILEEN